MTDVVMMNDTSANGGGSVNNSVISLTMPTGAASPNSMLQSNNTQSVADYLAQLLKDKKQLAALPNVFLHVERLLDDEIGKVRSSLFQINGIEKAPLVLPDGIGPVVTMSEKVYVPVKEFPDFNFVGRILGPRGMTAKQLEQETGCKIMVRGRGSMRDKKKEEQNRGKPNWEHLSDELHVLITVEDTENRCRVKLQRAVEEIKKLLVPAADGEDELKKRQLMELAIINGTYRDPTAKLTKGADLLSIYAPRLLTPGMAQLGSPAGLRSAASAAGGPLGAPLILSPRASAAAVSAALLNSAASGPPPLISAADAAAGLLYSPYAAAAADYSSYAAAAAAAAALSSPLLAEYPTGVPTSTDGGSGKLRRHLGSQIREHPYQRTDHN